MSAPKLYTIDEFAEYAGTTRKTVYDLLHRGGAPAHLRIGRFIRFTEAAILGWIEANTKPATKRQPRYRADRAIGARCNVQPRPGRPRKAGLAGEAA